MVGEGCTDCGERPTLLYECQYCGARYCADHNMPEAHDCDGVGFLSQTGAKFESTVDDSVVADESEVTPPEPVQPETVGTAREPDIERPPPVQTTADDRGGTFEKVLGWLPWR